MKEKPFVRVYGRENRLAEIHKVIHNPQTLDDMAIDMAYTILCTPVRR